MNAKVTIRCDRLKRKINQHICRGSWAIMWDLHIFTFVSIKFYVPHAAPVEKVVPISLNDSDVGDTGYIIIYDTIISKKGYLWGNLIEQVI